MKPLFNANDWEFANVSGEKTFLVELPDAGPYHLSVSGRSSEPLRLSLVTGNGQSIVVSSGNSVDYDGRILGFRAAELTACQDFAYRAHFHSIAADETIDPTPAAENVKLSPYDAMRIAVREEVIRRLHSAGLLDDGVDPDELVEDALKGDHDWLVEDDDDGFQSMSYEDMLDEEPVDDDSSRQSGEGPSEPEPPLVPKGPSESPKDPS